MSWQTLARFVAVIIGTVASVAWLDSRVSGAMQIVDGRVDRVEQRVEKKLDSIESKLDAVLRSGFERSNDRP